MKISQRFCKHIPYDLNISSKIKKKFWEQLKFDENVPLLRHCELGPNCLGEDEYEDEDEDDYKLK